MDPAACRLEEFADQGSGGGLAVAAGHCHNLAGAEIKEEFHLAGHHGARCNGVLQGLLVKFKAGGPQDDILALEAVHVVFTQAQMDTQAADGVGVFAKLLHRFLFITEGHLGPQPHKLLNQGLVADTCADEGDLFPAHQRGKLLLFLLHNRNSSWGQPPPICHRIRHTVYYILFLSNWQRKSQNKAQKWLSFLNISATLDPEQQRGGLDSKRPPCSSFMRMRGPVLLDRAPLFQAQGLFSGPVP